MREGEDPGELTIKSYFEIKGELNSTHERKTMSAQDSWGKNSFLVQQVSKKSPTEDYRITDKHWVVELCSVGPVNNETPTHRGRPTSDK